MNDEQMFVYAEAACLRAAALTEAAEKAEDAAKAAPDNITLSSVWVLLSADAKAAQTLAEAAIWVAEHSGD